MTTPPVVNKTTMTNPPTEATQMVAPQRPKIKALLQINVQGKTLAPGEVAEVSEEEAADFCKPYTQLNYAFGGERAVTDSPRHTLVRAERVG